MVLCSAVLLVACASAPQGSAGTATPAATPLATATPSRAPAPTDSPTSAPTATPASATTPTPALAPTATPQAGPVGAPLSTADLASLTEVYVSYRDTEPGEPPNRFPAGSIAAYKGLGALMPDGGEWALVQFVLTSSTPTLQQQVGMQDGANLGVFLRLSPNSQWLLRGVAGNPACASLPQIGVPVAVREMWGVAATCPG